ncbi:hypothetical protein [Novosphingobium rosa]|uniref:hypothetical protein n=1 Tax=Novosphingobium rosa TaxID=76978 RepID=UPI00083631EE|nr:hypothetical protein [Novosphingobium rosa]
MRISLTPLAAGCLMLAAPLWAQDAGMPAAAPVCTGPVTPTGALAPWVSPAPLTAGADGAHAALLKLGQAAQIALLPTPAVTYPLQPEKPGGSVSHGGVMALEVAQAGNYRIALSSGAWLDVVGADGAQRSVAHGHGPDCSGIRKMVDFALKPGRYTVQVSANGADTIRVLAVALP